MDKNSTRPGAKTVDETSRYRIASITKVFTVLGILQQHAAGNLSLEDTIDKYIPELVSGKNAKVGSIPWSHITIRSLASQISGIPRDWAQGDLLLDTKDPTAFGLPPIAPSAPERSAFPKCDSYGDYKPCTGKDLTDYLQTRPPLFAPNYKSTYSNVAYELLGIVLANVTGHGSYEAYIDDAILRPLNMTQTSFTKPDDSVAVLPKGIAWYWDVDEGVQNPTGGLFCSSFDMSMLLRHVLSEHRNIAGTNLDWLPLASTSNIGWGSYYSMPWETMQTDKILLDDTGATTGRPVTFFTKGGGLPGYSTLILLVPEYDLGITIFTAGDESDLLYTLLEMVTVPLIRAADALAARQVRDKYTGHFAATSKNANHNSNNGTLNSSLTLTYTPSHGLEIATWISNATDMMAVIPQQFQFPAGQKFHAQLIPTRLYRDAGKQQGELWRIAVTMEKNTKKSAASSASTSSNEEEERRDQPGAETVVRGFESPATFLQPLDRASSISDALQTRVWDDFCINDVDTMMYAGKPLNEVVFWDKGKDSASSEAYGSVELTAFRVTLERVAEKTRKLGDEKVDLVLQDL